MFFFYFGKWNFPSSKNETKKKTKQKKLSPKKQNFSCFGKNTCAVSIVARGNSYKIWTIAKQNPYEANTADEL